MKVLICGDSFSASDSGWTYELSKDFDVTNLSKSDVDQYDILQQIKSQNLNDYNVVILSNTNFTDDKKSKDMYELIDYEQDRLLTWNWVYKIRNYNSIRKTVGMIDNNELDVVKTQPNFRTIEDNTKIYNVIKNKIKRHEK
jgi:hypothetical protein